MMNRELSAPLENPENFEDRIFEFLELSRKILTLAKHENAILESCGFLTMEAYLKHRSALLKSYEDNAKTLIEDVISSSVHIDTKNLLSSELSAVQEALTHNTVYRFNGIQNSPSLKDGDSQWH
ncbi:MAG: hypothetical protein A3B66_01965 [Alphaproteobacteria bacterium RIFCSPHIGHO2_02_FULL_46_13]|nr:MAG: hypothetical protein A3B66_01965 [Alphaproteobacteria bacterium RIFCSPHIGHO2_02_FULL_46_13]